MKSRFFRLLSLFLLSLLLVTACNGTTTITSPPSPPSPPKLVPLKVSYSLWPGWFPLAIAEEKGFFHQQGVEVELVYSPNYQAPVSDFSAGKYDGVALALGSVMKLIEKNSNAQIILIGDRSAGADAIVAQRSIQSVAELKGKRLGAKLNDFGELFINAMLEKNGLNANEVQLVNLEAETIPEHLKSGDIQAGQTWEPYVSQAVKSGAKVLFSSKQTPGLIPDVILFNNDAVRDRAEQIKAFLRAWFQAQDYWKTNPEESKALIAKKLNIKPEEVSTDGIHLLNLQENLKALAPGSTEESLYHTAKLYADFYTRTGILSTVPDIQKLINSSFIQHLQSRG